MSRKIKFRAWDKENQTWTFVTLGDLVCGACLSSGDKPLSGARQIWEQYTGLKDKNGKEIYEGDIIKCYSQDTYPVGRVMYLEEWCVYEIVSYDPEDYRVYNLESFSPTVNKYLEVIGNIHENPELLGGDDE